MAWTVRDRVGNEITLTDERWQHIIEGHWELEQLLEQVLEAVRSGTRKQAAADPLKYRYAKTFQNLPFGYTHIHVIVRLASSKFIITAYPKQVR